MAGEAVLAKLVTDLAPSVKAETTRWSRAARWARVVGTILLLLMLLSAAYVVIFSRGVVIDTHRRNYNDLAISAHGLETWPADVKRLARTNFAKARLKAASIAEQTEGWRYASELEHPDLGTLRIRYTVADAGKACPQGEIDPITGRPLSEKLAFVRTSRAGGGQYFVVGDAERLDDIWASDMDSGSIMPSQRAARAETVAFYNTNLKMPENAGAAASNPPKKPANADADSLPDEAKGAERRLCFRVTVPLDRLVALERVGNSFSHLLVTDNDGKIFASAGVTELPIAKLGDLQPSTVGSFDLGSFFGSGKTAAKSEDLKIETLHGPAEITIGDTKYTVYVRNLLLPSLPPPCGAADAARPSGSATVPRSATCYIVALMPESTLRDRWFSPPPALIFGFAIVVLAALALLPALRLIMIGGNESIHGIEVAGVVLGVQMAAGLAVLALLFFIEISAERNGVHGDAEALANQMSRAAGREIGAALEKIQTVIQSGSGAAVTSTLPKPASDPQCPASNARKTDYPEIDPDLWACRTKTDPAESGSVLPAIESIAYFGANGRQAPGTRPIVYRDNVAVRVDISLRDYFIDLKRGQNLAPPPERGMATSYTIDVVRAQTDGIDKTVLAIAGRPPDTAKTVQPGAYLAPLVLRSFLAPVLPYPHHFLVIDRSRAALPVLFHSQRERGGVDQFAVQLGNRRDIRDRLAALPDRYIDDQPGQSFFHFSIPYDGKRQHFTAQAVPGTHWLVLVFHADDDIDVIAARAGRWTLFLWVAVGTALTLAMTAVVGLSGGGRLWYKPWLPAPIKVGAPALRGRWRRYWPHEAAGEDYKALMPLLVGGPSAMLVAVVATSMIGIPGLGVLLVVTGIVVILVVIARRLADVMPADAPLSPLTQRRFTRFAAALLMCTAALPTLAFWVDSLALASADSNGLAYQAARNAVSERMAQTTAIQRAFYDPAIHSGERLQAVRIDEGAGVFPPLGGEKAASPQRQVLVSEALRTLQNDLPELEAQLCDGETPGAICSVDPIGVAKRQLLRIYGAGFAPDAATGMRFIAICLLAAGLVFGLAAFTWRIFRSLFGFDVALAPAELPRLWIADGGGTPPDGDNELKAKSLLVAPQQALRSTVLDARHAQVVDLVAATAKILDAAGKEVLPPRVPWGRKPRLVAVGLELILRDPERRRAALAILESYAALAATSNSKRNFVIISDRAPLDRILDAFDIERQRKLFPDSDTAATHKAREELRWAMLFQDFATYIFAPVDKIDNVEATKLISAAAKARDWPPATQLGVATLVDELRWLPGRVIDGAIFQKTNVGEEGAEGLQYSFPLAAAAYRLAYTPSVTAWACDLRPASAEAAIDFARDAVIEFYQQCWSSSTHGERLILDALARGRFVNFVAALALKSLVRRGLVVLDPSPRLMNASFATFVRQAERPETIASWRVEQPDGGWSAARLPIALGLGVMVLTLGAVVGSDLSFGTLAPLFAAGAPALTTTLANLFRRA